MSSGSNNTVVIIPALNEEASIGSVLSGIPKEWVSEVIVVDNGSTDKTADTARRHGATVLTETRRGYGWACLKGIDYVRGKAPDIIVFLDGDFSDYPEELPHLVEPIINGDADMVIGSRMMGDREKGALLPQAIFGNWLAGFLIKILWGFRFTDLGPFRAIRFSALKNLGMEDKTYGWTVEMQIKAVRVGLRCREVPVSYRKRIGVSKVTGTISGTIRASAKILWTIARYAVRRTSPGVN